MSSKYLEAIAAVLAFVTRAGLDGKIIKGPMVVIGMDQLLLSSEHTAEEVNEAIVVLQTYSPLPIDLVVSEE